MNYTVEHEKEAENDLASIWIMATDRNRIVAASATLDREMAHDPLTLGESRESSVRRVAFCPPIGVEFEVIEDDKRVVVEAVFRAG